MIQFSRFLCMVVAIWFAVCSPAYSDTEDDASDFVSQRGEDLIEILNNPDLEERHADFSFWLRDTFDLNSASRLALGLYAAQITEDEFEEYNITFVEYITEVYRGRFQSFDFSDVSFKIVRVRILDDENIAVYTNIGKGSGKEYEVIFRLNLIQNEFMVLDFLVGGISMLKVQRDEFTSVLYREGIEGLIYALKDRISDALSGAQ